LPGLGEAAAPGMEPPPGAVPLPGLDEGSRSAPETASADDSGERVPLPGMGDESQSMEQTAVDFRPPPPKAPAPAADFSAVPLPGLDDKPPPAASESGDPFANLDLGGEPMRQAKAPAPKLDLPEPAAPPPAA